jgi:hypothetical protein
MEQLNEMTPAEQAKALGLEYGGFGGWIDSNRKVVARTINGKLVKVDDQEEAQVEEDLGRIIVFDFDDELLYTDMKKATPEIKKIIYLIKSLIKTGSDTVILHSRNSERKVAEFLKKVGVTSGPTLIPIGSSEPNKKREFVEKKIKAGYSEIQFFDRDPKSVHAIESLKAPYNRLEIKIETHQIPKLKYDPETRPSSDTEGKV